MDKREIYNRYHKSERGRATAYRWRMRTRHGPDWEKVFERDGYACVACGSKENLNIDHIVPVGMGGESTVENQQTMCRPCHHRKDQKLRWGMFREAGIPLSIKTAGVSYPDRVDPLRCITIPPHGTRSRYRGSEYREPCRCDECRLAQRRHDAAYRERKKARAAS